MALQAGWKVFTDPESRVRDMTAEQRAHFFEVAYAYYRSEIFTRRNGTNWQWYLTSREMYKYTRLLFNPVPMIDDFHIDNIWRPAHNDDFESLVTPVTAKTDEKLVAAIAQIDQWSNFQSDMQKIKRYAAVTGNVLVEGFDDIQREKVLHQTFWPGFVQDIELNATGDVQSYVLEYDVWDPALKKNYRYRKVVTKETFEYFKDDKPFTPDGASGPKERNPYGFVFAVWIRHKDDGGNIGVPAFTHWDKVDEANSLGSHLHDNIHKEIESAKLIAAKDEVLPIIGGSQNSKTKKITTGDTRLDWVVFKASEGASVHDLSGQLKLAEAHPYLKGLLESFSDDYPELQAAAVIRENSQLSGAALERMLTPAQNKLDASQANYNGQLIKLRQMQMAVAGMRLNGGGWKQKTDQQKKFADFNLRSYEKGELDFNLQRSLLVQSTEAETEDLLQKKATRATTLEGIVDEREQLSIAGYNDEQTDEILQRKAKENELIEDPNKVDPPIPNE